VGTPLGGGAALSLVFAASRADASCAAVGGAVSSRAISARRNSAPKRQSSPPRGVCGMCVRGVGSKGSKSDIERVMNALLRMRSPASFNLRAKRSYRNRSPFACTQCTGARYDSIFFILNSIGQNGKFNSQVFAERTKEVRRKWRPRVPAFPYSETAHRSR
jgi:hypothetical protein